MIEPTDLNLRHLDAAHAVGVLGSITAAAMTVNLSQPTLTQALGKLEGQLSLRLFDRQPGGVRATAAGRLFDARVERALDRLVESCRLVRRGARLAPLAHPQRHLTMTQLRAFLAVQRAGSFLLAARALGISQPSVHRAARELELVLGVPLLARVGKGVRATIAGERMAQGARLALAELRAGLDELALSTDEGAGRVVIGTLPLPRAGLLPRALARFAAAHPRTQVVILEAPYGELMANLQTGEIDLLVGALRPEAAGSGVVQRPLFADELFIVGAVGHPLTRRRVNAAALAGYPWIVGPPGAPMRATWDALFVDTPPPERRIECGSILIARGLLLAGDWLALMSPDQFRIEKEAGLLTAIGGGIPGSRRQIGLVTRADWRPTAVQAAMVAALDAVAAEHQ